MSSARSSRTAFTLAELLIALAILGVIATFTIPKVLQAQQNSQRIAVFKETIAALNQAYYEEYTTKAHYNTIVGHYLDIAAMNLNYIKICPNNATTEGCWTQGGTAAPGEQIQGGFILHNGATLAGFENYNGGGNGIVIDWNGSAPPNSVGDDQMVMYIQSSGTDLKTVGLFLPSGGMSTTLYESIFSQ